MTSAGAQALTGVWCGAPSGVQGKTPVVSEGRRPLKLKPRKTCRSFTFRQIMKKSKYQIY